MKKLRLLFLLFTISTLFLACSSESTVLRKEATIGREPENTIADQTSLAASSPLTDPTFSKESGFYEKSFELHVTAPEGCQVYYTIDGSIPTNTSVKLEAKGTLTVYDKSKDANVYSMHEGTTAGNFYAPSYLIDKATVIRAITYDELGNHSNVVTKTYFIGFASKADYYKEVAVISLVTSPDNLFHYDNGIYVTGATHDEWLKSPDYDPKVRYWHQPANYKNRGMDWEREAHMDFFDSNQSLVISQDIGIRMRGGASSAFLQKSFNLYARKEYGEKKVEYELFPDLISELGNNRIATFKSVMLRNGGNDTELTKIREVMHHRLASHLNISVQASRPAIVFLNGEFWGLYNLQEKYSEDYIASHYGVEKTNVIIIKKDELDEGEESDIDLYNTFLEYVRNTDFSVGQNYEELGAMLDIDSFIDYVSFEVYIGNVDWGSNNVMLWRSRTIDDKEGSSPYCDGRWRWMLYDTDYSTGLSYENSLVYDVNYNPSRYDNNSFQKVLHPSSTVGLVFTALMENSTFRDRFYDRFLEIADTTFAENSVKQILEEYRLVYSPMMVDTLLRYKPLTEAQALEQFEYEVDKIRNYYSLRYEFITGALRDIFVH